MDKLDSVVAVFADHNAAEAAIKDLAAAGFDLDSLSVVGKGYRTEEKVIGFYNFGDRVRFWGSRGAFWGGLWGLFFGGLFVTVPLVGQVVVLGYAAILLMSVLENAIVVGGLSALGAALYGMGIPKDSVIVYEAAIRADNFVVMVHASAADLIKAHAILDTGAASRVDHHQSAQAEPQPQFAPKVVAG